MRKVKTKSYCIPGELSDWVDDLAKENRVSASSIVTIMLTAMQKLTDEKRKFDETNRR